MRKEILNEISNNKELSKSPLLLSWIQESEENLNAYIEYKNRFALMQNGESMTEHEINKALETIKKKNQKSNNISLKRSFFRYVAFIVIAIFGAYIYHLSSSIFNPKSSPQITMNEISVPKGSRSDILLPDGSKVVLLNGSKITYPSNFTDKMYEVYIEGKAFLSVAHNRERIFKVHIEKHAIEVLGTEFLVVAYPEDDLIQVDLVSGKVKMNVANETNNYDSYIMKPTDNLVLNKTNKNVTVQKNQDDFYKFWKDGEYLFKEESFVSLARKLERIYHVTILFKDKLLEKSKFTGALYSNSSLTTTLEVFKKASGIPFEYNIDNNQVYIKQLN